MTTMPESVLYIVDDCPGALAQWRGQFAITSGLGLAGVAACTVDALAGRLAVAPLPNSIAGVCGRSEYPGDRALSDRHFASGGRSASAPIIEQALK